MSTSEPLEGQNISFVLWVVLWGATIQHAGLTLWAMLLTAQLPPGYQVPAGWVGLFWKGPDPETYWTYVIVLGINILWESRFKGRKTYLRSSFPFPDMLYGNTAGLLWLVLGIFAFVGEAKGWFPMPDQLVNTFFTCLLLSAFQDSYFKKRRESEESQDEMEDEPQPVKAPITQISPAVAEPKPTTKPVDAGEKGLSEKLLDYIHQNGQAKTGAMAGAMGVHRRTVIRNLKKLVEQGRLVREGNGPGAVYRLNNNQKDE